jgi:peptidoglycan/xylan/chitin deacetylase (PgdA/CDA1 family)
MSVVPTTKAVLKYIWRKSGAYRVQANRAGSFVLSYHRVKPLSSSLIDTCLGAISPSCLERTLSMLRDLDFHFISSDELRELSDESRKAVCITFDDGLRDVVDFALPILREYRAPSTVFLITSIVDRQDLLWQHRLYESIDRLPVAECLKHLSAFGELSDKDAFASGVVQQLGRIELEEAALALANAAGMSEVDEMNLAKQLYLREEDVDLMNRNEMAVAGHSHEHWPASKHTATELQADYHACMTALSQLSDRRAFQFGVPFGDVSNGCVSLAKKAGFSDVYISEGFFSPVNEKAFPRVWPHGGLDDFAMVLSQQFRRQSETLASVKARYLRGISLNGETAAAP